jgi:hypothetical protein
MNLKGKKLTRKPKLNALAKVDNLPAAQTACGSSAIQIPTVPKEISEVGKKEFKDWMKRTFGTEDTVLQNRFLDQSIMAVGDFVGHEMESFDHVAAALRGIKPKDALEGMLAVQMVAVHTLAMECMGRAAVKEQPDLGVEVNLSRATKLMRTFASQTEALGRYRGKGEQRMTVEHVHVYQGGQAIVGQVSQKNTRVNRKNSDNEDRNE